MQKSEESLHELWSTIKQMNICITGIPGKESKGQKDYLKK